MLKTLTGLALAGLAATAAFAQDTPKPAPTPKPEGEKLICRTVGDSASRLGGKRDCRTKAAWERTAKETGDALRGVSGQPR